FAVAQSTRASRVREISARLESAPGRAPLQSPQGRSPRTDRNVGVLGTDARRGFPSLFVAARAKAAASSSLLELGVDEILKREDLIPFLLGEKLLLLHDDVVEALTRLVAFSRKLGTLPVTQRGLEQSHDTQGIEHHVSRAFGVRSNA